MGLRGEFQFTLKHEENNFIPFLDVGITKEEDKLVTKV